MMRRTFLAVFALALVTGGLALAQQPTPAPVRLPGTDLTFVPPAGYTAWTPEMITRKFPAARPPKAVYADDERGRISIALTVTDRPAELKTLAQLQELLERIYGALPGMRWLKKETVTLNGVRWVHVELATRALDTGIINNIYATIREDKLVMVNCNVVQELNEPRVRDLLQKSIATLKPAE